MRHLVGNCPTIQAESKSMTPSIRLRIHVWVFGEEVMAVTNAVPSKSHDFAYGGGGPYIIKCKKLSILFQCLGASPVTWSPDRVSRNTNDFGQKIKMISGQLLPSTRGYMRCWSTSFQSANAVANWCRSAAHVVVALPLRKTKPDWNFLQGPVRRDYTHSTP